MGVYNCVYGEFVSVSCFLLCDVLCCDWGFKGYVVLDCWVIVDIWKYYYIVFICEVVVVLVVKNGIELECG